MATFYTEKQRNTAKVKQKDRNAIFKNLLNFWPFFFAIMADQGQAGLPNGTHINPNFKKAAGSNIHINPKFQNGAKTSSSSTSSPSKPRHQQGQGQGQVHVNPKFLAADLSSTSVPKSLESSGSKIHVNPKFANRALPPIPSTSSTTTPSTSKSRSQTPSYAQVKFLDGKKAKAYEEAIKIAVEAKTTTKKNNIHVNPNFAKNISPSEKENVNMAASTKATIKTPSSRLSSAKNMFKKIGKRKLVRDNSKASVTKVTPLATPKSSFTKIGTRKLIRRSSKISPKSAVLSATKSAPPLTGIYKVKTNNKIIKKHHNSPHHFKSSNIFTTPFSSKKRRRSSPYSNNNIKTNKPKVHTHFKLSRVLNPFRVDRRVKPAPRAATNHNQNNKVLKRSATPSRLSNNKMQQKVAKPAVVTPEMKRPLPPAKPARKTPVRPKAGPGNPTTLINVQGVRYTVSDNGKKLNRIQGSPKPPAPATTPSTTATSEAANRSINVNNVKQNKLYLAGEEYVEDEPGVLIRSRNSMTRASITSAKQRSIHTILKSQTRSKQYCMFFNKFGKCKKKEDGVCPYIHDPEKVAVCRKFLQGNCHRDNCLLSHKVIFRF